VIFIRLSDFQRKSLSVCAKILRDLQAAEEKNVKFIFTASLLHNLLSHPEATEEGIRLVQHRMISLGN
jgi:hypothetical protein